jgi:hypothetical protein
MKCETLREFRQLAYKMLGPAKDATFELMDAVMTTPKANCLTEMALNPCSAENGQVCPKHYRTVSQTENN